MSDEEAGRREDDEDDRGENRGYEKAARKGEKFHKTHHETECPPHIIAYSSLSRQYVRWRLKIQIELGDIGAAVSKCLYCFNYEEGDDNDHYPYDRARQRSARGLEFFGVAAGKEEVESADDEHDEEGYTGKCE